MRRITFAVRRLVKDLPMAGQKRGANPAVLHVSVGTFLS